MCGVSGNCGTTHLCIALSHFLSGKFVANTAYLEVNASNEIASLSKKTDKTLPFTKNKITYYPKLTLSNAEKILTKHYKYFVLDFGNPNSHTFPVFTRCDIKIIIGYTQPWKQAAYEKFVHEHTFIQQKNKEDCYYIGNIMGSRGSLDKLSKKLGVRMIPMPFFSNPFQITSEQFSFFEEILGGK